MSVDEIVKQFKLNLTAGSKGMDAQISGGHCGDLLSEVMGNAPAGCVWLTVQGHQNIVAVAMLREMTGIIITGGHNPDPETVKKADEEGIPLMKSCDSSFELAGKLYAAGIW